MTDIGEIKAALADSGITDAWEAAALPWTWEMDGESPIVLDARRDLVCTLDGGEPEVAILIASAPSWLGELIERCERAERIARMYAPPDRMDAWHAEECFLEPRDWLWEQWTEVADETPGGMPWEERERIFNAWAAAQPAPTDRDMCSEGCPYADARAALGDQ